MSIAFRGIGVCRTSTVGRLSCRAAHVSSTKRQVLPGNVTALSRKVCGAVMTAPYSGRVEKLKISNLIFVPKGLLNCPLSTVHCQLERSDKHQFVAQRNQHDTSDSRLLNSCPISNTVKGAIHYEQISERFSRRRRHRCPSGGGQQHQLRLLGPVADAPYHL